MSYDADILLELKRMRDTLEKLPKAITAAIVADLFVPEEPEVPSDECPHPVSLRTNLDDGEWVCGVRDCRYHHVELEVSRL